MTDSIRNFPQSVGHFTSPEEDPPYERDQRAVAERGRARCESYSLGVQDMDVQELEDSLGRVDYQLTRSPGDPELMAWRGVLVDAYEGRLAEDPDMGAPETQQCVVPSRRSSCEPTHASQAGVPGGEREGAAPQTIARRRAWPAPGAPHPLAALPPVDNNAARTSSRTEFGAYAQAGRTAGGNGVFAGAAVHKTRDARSGTEVELVSASGQLGLQSEVQAAVSRAGVSGDVRGVHGSLAVDTLTARAHAGFRNDDGSLGMNVGAVATAVGVEGTLAGDDWSVAAG